MLVLSRKRNESVLIQAGDYTIEVVLKNTSKGAAKLGIDADKQVSIQRSEIATKPQNACVSR